MQRQLKIAEIVLVIDSGQVDWASKPDSSYRLFQTEQEDADVQVDVHWQPVDRECLGEEVLSVRQAAAPSSPAFRVYRDGRGFWCFEVSIGGYPLFVSRVAVFQPDFRRGDVYVEVTRKDAAVYPFPLAPPLDRILLAHYLARRGGLLLHGCGVAQDGVGHVFVGQSGAGKTTLARLWAEQGDATVLGEECLILRKKDSRFWVYGTPWTGEAELCSAIGVPISL